MERCAPADVPKVVIWVDVLGWVAGAATSEFSLTSAHNTTKRNRVTHSRHGSALVA
jgi:hypothetical protein